MSKKVFIRKSMADSDKFKEAFLLERFKKVIVLEKSLSEVILILSDIGPPYYDYPDVPNFFLLAALRDAFLLIVSCLLAFLDGWFFMLHILTKTNNLFKCHL